MSEDSGNLQNEGEERRTARSNVEAQAHLVAHPVEYNPVDPSC